MAIGDTRTLRSEGRCQAGSAARSAAARGRAEGTEGRSAHHEPGESGGAAVPDEPRRTGTRAGESACGSPGSDSQAARVLRRPAERAAANHDRAHGALREPAAGKK